MSNSTMLAPPSPTSPGFRAQARRRSSIFSGFAILSSHGQGRRGSRWSIASCFSENSDSDKNEASSQHDYSPPVSPIAVNFDQSTIASRRKSYVPKRAVEPFPLPTTPMCAREAGAAPANRTTSKRTTYATKYGCGQPANNLPMETVAASKE